MEYKNNQSFSLNRDATYTKPITVQKFIINEYEYSELNLQNDLHHSLKENENKSFPLNGDIMLKCRKYLNKNGHLFAFISFYDSKLDISITKENSKDEISAESIDNADTCHLFIMLEKNNLFAFSTISSLHLLSKVGNAIKILLDNKKLHIMHAIDNDIVNIIKSERVAEIGIEAPVDLMSLGFKKENFFTRLLGDPQKTVSNMPYGKIIFDKKNNPVVIERIEEAPHLALEYINDDETDTSNNIYIKTKKRRIDGKNLKKQSTYYVIPYLKTRTILWGDAIAILENASI
ncbi:hypothetical protein [Pasteurella multocida]|uniref:hypothetical protein n=1 Tax=Pasteurella multocida TaxID=747 RepID=UPI00397C5F66